MSRRTILSLCAIAALGAVTAVGIAGVRLYRIWQERIAIDGLNDIDSRSAAVESLRQSRSRLAVPHLVALLGDEDRVFRREVLQALEEIGLDVDAEPVVRECDG